MVLDSRFQMLDFLLEQRIKNIEEKNLWSNFLISNLHDFQKKNLSDYRGH